MSLNYIHRKCNTGYLVNRRKRSVTLCTLTTLNCFQKMKKERESLLDAVRIYSQDTVMEFGKEKCAKLPMKSSKRHLTNGIELPNKDKITTIEKNETYKYLGILEDDTIKQEETREKIKKEYCRKTRNQL